VRPPWRRRRRLRSAALRLYRELSHRGGEAETLTHLGDTHRHVGAFQAASQAWREALDILDQLGHPGADQVRAKLNGAREVTRTPWFRPVGDISRCHQQAFPPR
jgi:predicted TPR repeat methyltransferase